MKEWLKVAGLLSFILCVICVKSQSVNDYDGNTYKLVQIGNQLWFAENIKTTHFNDGTPINQVIESQEWDSLAEPAFCWYNNTDSLYKDEYGALYNWYAVKSEKLCPIGWHVPSAVEWDTLVAFLNGNQIAGGSLKEMGIGRWKSPNTGATNESGFTALPGGVRVTGNGFANFGSSGYWWTSTEFKDGKACSRILIYYSNVIYKDHNDFRNGYSVRCIKDE